MMPGKILAQVRMMGSLESLMYVVIATVSLGLANFLLKVGLQHGAVPETLVSMQAWVFSSTATLMAFWPERRLIVSGNTWRFSTPAAIVLVIAFVLLAHGLQSGPASVLVPIAQMSFVFTALLGATIFREPLNARKVIGLLIAAAALVLFAVS